MKIISVECHLIAPAWSADRHWRLGHTNSAAIVVIRSDDGVTGIGESILGHFAPGIVPSVVDFYRPLLIGEDPYRIEYLWQKLYQNSIWWGKKGVGLSVLSAVDIALWDLKGKALGVPVYDLLGGLVNESIPVYASAGPALWPPERTVEMVSDYRDLGYRATKVGTMAASEPFYTYDATASRSHYSVPPLADMARMEAEKVAALRQALGSDFDLAVDGHQGAHPRPATAGEAIRTAQALEPYGMLFFEEPLSYEDIPGWAELRRRTTVPIAGGESLSGLSEFEAFIRAGALDIVQPDLSWVGGISAARKVLDLAEANRLRSAMHSGGTPGPGFAASLHLAAAHPTTLILERIPAVAATQADFIVDPLDVVDGRIAAPTAPGLGLRLTDEYVEKNALREGMGVRT